ncbi:MAG: hypothetical protein IT416_00980 [Candidatus Pacebacteria bacterium]|nr:hypothetical protein [Candidatus Paceibacterota bacterium]
MSKKTSLILLSALLLRLLLMPWFAHEDIFSDYRRAEQMAFANQSVFGVITIVPHFIETINLKFFSLFLGNNIFKVVHLELIDQTSINSLLFIFKLPYLVAEILIWWLFIKFFKPTTKILLLLVFNPITIYSVYLFGRYESFIMLFTLLVMLAIKQNKKLLAGIIMAINLLSKVSLALVLPAFIFLKYSKKELLKLTILAIIPAIIFQSWLVPRAITLLGGQHFGYLLASNLKIGPLSINLFSLFYLTSLLIMYRLSFKNSQLKDLEKFSLATVLLLFSYYITSLFHPHYFTWVIIPMLYLMNQLEKNQPLVNIFVLLNLFFFGWLLYWDGFTNIGLLFPIFSNFITVNPQSLVVVDLQTTAYLAKNIMAGLMIYFAFLLVKHYRKSK